MWYATISVTVFCYWLGLFIADKSTPKNHVASWLILLIAPLFWPIVLPVSILELVTKSSSSQKKNLGEYEVIEEATEVSYQNN
jgi:hypothetical protein